MSLWREDTATDVQKAAGENYPDPLTVPAGAIFRRSDDGTQTYVTTTDVVFAGSPGAGSAGESTKTGVFVKATTSGALANCDTGLITEIVSAPGELIAVSNTVAIGNGSDRESDGKLRERVLIYMASLARCQPSSLEFAALDFVSTTGARAMFAKVYEDPSNRGYSELVIDDGSGLSGSATAGSETTGIVPSHGAAILYHDAPAVGPIESVLVNRGGVTTTYYYNDGDYISLPERGLIYFPEGVLLSGDVWKVSGYDVYTALISELQQYIEGDTSRPVDFPGWRAAGTRVVVRPATIEYLSFDIHIIPKNYIALSDVSTEIEKTCVEFFRGLAPGETLYVAQLLDKLMENQKVLSLRLYEPGTSTFLADHPATNYDNSWRTSTDRITIIPAVEES